MGYHAEGSNGPRDWRTHSPWLGLTVIVTTAGEGKRTRNVDRCLHKDADSKAQEDLVSFDG